jgi:hypothetical protein
MPAVSSPATPDGMTDRCAAMVDPATSGLIDGVGARAARRPRALPPDCGAQVIVTGQAG